MHAITDRQRIIKDVATMDNVGAGSVASSFLLHGLIVILAIVGLPYMKPDLPPVNDSIVVELVDIAELTQTTEIREVGSVKDIKPKPSQSEKTVPKPKAAPQVTSSAPPSVFSAPTPNENAIAAPSKVPPPLKKPKPKAAPKEDRKPVLIDETLDPAEQQEDFESVLKNLLPSEQESDSGEKMQDPQAAPKSKGLLAPKMARSELDALKYQLAKCWNLMAGAKYAEDLVVDLRLIVNPDRTVRQAEIIQGKRYRNDSYFRAAADAAMRAIRNPACSPLDLPADKYDVWKSMVVRFDPREMLL